MPGRRDRRRVEVLRDDGHGLVADEGRAAADHLVEHAAERVEVAGGRRLAAHRLLRRHVARRADHHPGLRQPRAVERHRQAEVADLGDAAAVEPDVARLQVAVDDALRVGELEARAHLVGDAHAPARAAAGGLALLAASTARSPPAMSWETRYGCAVLVADVEDGDDVRVVAEPAHRLRLALHARQAVGVEALGLDQREGDVAVEQRVVRQVDLLLAALAEEALHLVAAVAQRSRQWHGWRSAWRRGVRLPDALGVVDGRCCAPTAVPQESQNRADGLSSALQEAQRAASAVPHDSQKRAPSRFSLPQDEQFKSNPLAFGAQ